MAECPCGAHNSDMRDGWEIASYSPPTPRFDGSSDIDPVAAISPDRAVSG